ncbi:hypothetical protein WA026_018576 [Henosepilachna vigintioctopunctata]|uniref:Uncharacterized protein n=1 Tax=Henosepilachna vigintioctopunctata TaxID=420089 RepID=A0AAW1U8Q0_9CUCU
MSIANNKLAGENVTWFSFVVEPLGNKLENASLKIYFANGYKKDYLGTRLQIGSYSSPRFREPHGSAAAKNTVRGPRGRDLSSLSYLEKRHDAPEDVAYEYLPTRDFGEFLNCMIPSDPSFRQTSLHYSSVSTVARSRPVSRILLLIISRGGSAVTAAAQPHRVGAIFPRSRSITPRVDRTSKKFSQSLSIGTSHGKIGVSLN